MGSVERRVMQEFHTLGNKVDELIQTITDNYYKTTEEVTSKIYLYRRNMRISRNRPTLLSST